VENGKPGSVGAGVLLGYLLGRNANAPRAEAREILARDPARKASPSAVRIEPQGPDLARGPGLFYFGSEDTVGLGREDEITLGQTVDLVRPQRDADLAQRARARGGAPAPRRPRRRD